MARPSGRTNSVKGLVGVAIIRLVGRRAETPLRRGQGKSDLPLLLCRLELFRFGAFSLCWHPDLATVRSSLAVFGRASCWGLLFEQDQTKNARHSLPFDDDAARKYGEIRSALSRLGKPIGPNDLMIAATALVHGAVLITHNTREFSRVEGLQIEDWEES